MNAPRWGGPRIAYLLTAFIAVNTIAVNTIAVNTEQAGAVVPHRDIRAECAGYDESSLEDILAILGA